jgi:signal transduction histidine kinase
VRTVSLETPGDWTNKSRGLIKEEFIASISPEPRTPLTIAKSPIEFVLQEGLCKAQRKILVRRMKNIDKLNKTVGDSVETAQPAENLIRGIGGCR